MFALWLINILQLSRKMPWKESERTRESPFASHERLFRHLGSWPASPAQYVRHCCRVLIVRNGRTRERRLYFKVTCSPCVTLRDMSCWPAVVTCRLKQDWFSGGLLSDLSKGLLMPSGVSSCVFVPTRRTYVSCPCSWSLSLQSVLDMSLLHSLRNSSQILLVLHEGLRKPMKMLSS